MECKKYSDWLVVSDIDGTLNNKFRQLPKRNFEAIKHFVLKCNGHFTLASGRNVESMRKHYNRLPIKGTPAVVLNGAGVYDYSQEKMLHFTPINQKAVDLVFEIYKRFPALEIEILTDKVIFAESKTGNIDIPKVIADEKCEIVTDTGNIKITIEQGNKNS